MPTYWEPCPGKRKATRAIVHLKLKKLKYYYTSKSLSSEAGRGGFSARAKNLSKS